MQLLLLASWWYLVLSKLENTSNKDWQVSEKRPKTKIQSGRMVYGYIPVLSDKIADDGSTTHFLIFSKYILIFFRNG